MGIRFQAADVKQVLVPIPCDMSGCTAEERCGYCEDGTFQDPRHTGPSVEFHMGGATAVMRLLGIYNAEDPSYGTIPATEIGNLRQKLLVAKNSERRRSGEVREPSDSQEPGQPRVICGSMDDDSLVRRLNDLDKVLADCQSRGQDLRWF